MCNFCAEECHAHGHKTMTISDVCNGIRELGLQKRSEIERHMSSITEDSNCELAKIERIDHVSYNWLYRQHFETYVLMLHDRKVLFLFNGQTIRIFSHFTRMNVFNHLQQRHNQ